MSNSLLYHLISKACILFSHFAVNVHDLHAYRSIMVFLGQSSAWWIPSLSRLYLLITAKIHHSYMACLGHLHNGNWLKEFFCPGPWPVLKDFPGGDLLTPLLYWPTGLGDSWRWEYHIFSDLSTAYILCKYYLNYSLSTDVNTSKIPKTITCQLVYLQFLNYNLPTHEHIMHKTITLSTDVKSMPKIITL